MPLDAFEKLLGLLSKYFQFLNLNDIFSINDLTNNIKKPYLLLTFDDGYKNNFEYVMPILEKKQIPAAFFTITGSLDNGNFLVWPDIIDLVLYFQPLQRLRIDEHDFSINGSQKERLQSKGKIYNLGRKMGAERLDLIDNMASLIPEKQRKKFSDQLRLMDVGELAEASRNRLFHIGSHSHRHFCLGSVSENLQIEEIEKSLAILRKINPTVVNSFAFPDGSFNATTLKILSEHSIEFRFAVEEYEPTYKNQVIPRLSVSNTTTPEVTLLTMLKKKIILNQR
jgi:peptidoglycan/xylan/chitin deacetylase (PgdA/CDA1 family)